MDRSILLNGTVSIPLGHRVEVSESSTADSAAGVRIHTIVDLDTGVEHRWDEHRPADAVIWTGRVLQCSIRFSGNAGETLLLIDPFTPGALGAKAALRGADAAADAAKAEADRWGGADRPPPEPEERFW
ncbi:hypothetical protein JOD62_002589 [Microbacterium keratanolyticum]|nr:hypothetical protein [Microbacterium keratanolyticum]MBM7470041.1 hypothetical protein [Microbacterium keratanolyticum]